MGDDLFVDLWQTQTHTSRAGPLVPTTHQIADPGKRYFIKQEISRLWKLPQTRARNPAPNPVSLERKDMLLLKHNKYVVAEKTDGVRYLLLLSQYPRHLGGQPCAVMIDRRDVMFEVRVMAEEDVFQGSLFDGELVWEYEGGQYIPPRQVLLVFDTVACRGVSLVHKNFVQRFGIASEIFDLGGKDITQDPRKWIETAQELAEKHLIICEGNQYCLCFRPKRIMPINQLDIVWRTRKTLKHKSDGLIFTPIDTPVLVGTHQTMFKWKSQHTIDVVWKAQWNQNHSHWDYLILYLNGGKECRGDREGVILQKPAILNEKTEDDAREREVPIIIVPNEYSRKILDWHYFRGEYAFTHVVECTCKLPSDLDWMSGEIPIIECSILKIRHDKLQANQKNTIERTLQNIQENISIHEILEVLRT